MASLNSTSATWNFRVEVSPEETWRMSWSIQNILLTSRIPCSLLGTSILAAFFDGSYHSSIVLRRRSKALLLEGFRRTWTGTEVEGDSEPDMGDEADIGSTIETGGTKRGSEEFESEDLVELLEE